MRLVKYFETGLDVQDPNHIFCANYEESLLALLKKKFNGRCYKSSYILDILQIIDRGHLCCKGKSLDGGAYVHLRFMADCLIYDEGEIIQGCKVIQISDQDVILGKSKYCAVHIKNILGLSIFKEGDEIPVVVKAVRYNLSDTEISVLATTIYPCGGDETKFRLSDAEFHENKAEEEAVTQLNTEIKKFNVKAIKYFTELLYPLKKYNNYEKIAKPIPLEKIRKLQANDVVFIGNKYLNDAHIYQCIDSAEADVVMSLQSIYDRALHQHKKNLANLLGFLETYDIPKIKQRAALWKAYAAAKN